MNKLDNQDLSFCVRRLPKKLKEIMISEDWKNKIFVAGGYIRSVIANEPINDIDIFVNSKKEAELLAYKLAGKEDIICTDNAYTVKGKIPYQIIHRWTFETAEDTAKSFDFTICSGVISYDANWDSYCNERFYIDLAAKRLVYTSPMRNEDAGGSLLRVLKYYQRGYRIPINFLGAVVARLVKDLEPDKIDIKDEAQVGKVLTGLLRLVDPNVDPLHESHLPNTEELTTDE